MSEIPPSFIGAMPDILATIYSHNDLESIFLTHGFSNIDQVGSKPKNVRAWLRSSNTNNRDALEKLTKLLAEYMDKPDEEYNFETKEKIRTLYKKENYNYGHGGVLIGSTLMQPSLSLAEKLSKNPIQTINTEYKRAVDAIELDPPAAVTSACSILESLCKTIIEDFDASKLPNKQLLPELWKITANLLDIHPEKMASDDLKMILQGLFAIVKGIADFRTHEGSAHGKSEESLSGKKYRISSRHARLAVHSAHTLVLFVIETWEARKKR